jgi:hypothetical protein
MIDWLIGSNFPDLNVMGSLATNLPRSTDGLRGKVRNAAHYYPCDVLLVHRDAENRPPAERVAEIDAAMIGLPVPFVPIVPVRMTEAWLLISEHAVRRAAGNPNGTIPLNLPSRDAAEGHPDPKQALFEALASASELGARRRATLNLPAMRRRVAEYIQDFSRLRHFQTFTEFDNRLNTAITNWVAAQVVVP